MVVNLDIGANIQKAGKTDRFREALDYRALKKKILSLIERSNYHLIEALAEAIAVCCLKEPKAVQIKVRVEKPSALRFAKSVGVEIIRFKKA